MEKASASRRLIQVFEAETRDAERVQRETLEKILKQNEETEYLKKFGLNGKWDEETFRKCVPLASHRDFEPYIQRIAEGDASPILAAKPFTVLTRSSGTSEGKPRFLPFNEALSQSMIQQYATLLAYTLREFSVEEGMVLKLLHASPRPKTKGGLDVGTLSSNILHNFPPPVDDKLQPCSPSQVLKASDYQQTLYCHFLCGLLCSDRVQFLQTLFFFQLVQAFRTFESIWEELCADIREGRLSTERVTDLL
ncbi:hypothetical protein H6P81_002284 [Aristolochia fimbriata]|uniref:Uncharacterized protein n=1 Tax=Aristolochia fimbriata TaxID=158543 RepID=A0AAV7FAI1_ARIFI|nr:hypothetical protein H6P81_002284 [Aristolochia fimbriata]